MQQHPQRSGSPQQQQPAEQLNGNSHPVNHANAARSNASVPAGSAIQATGQPGGGAHNNLQATTTALAASDHSTKRSTPDVVAVKMTTEDQSAGAPASGHDAPAAKRHQAQQRNAATDAAAPQAADNTNNATANGAKAANTAVATGAGATGGANTGAASASASASTKARRGSKAGTLGPGGQAAEAAREAEAAVNEEKEHFADIERQVRCKIMCVGLRILSGRVMLAGVMACASAGNADACMASVWQHSRRGHASCAASFVHCTVWRGGLLMCASSTCAQSAAISVVRQCGGVRAASQRLRTRR